ncbi:MAG: hypothetical protein Q9220_004188 [cf. Caloplaca sp. 1 TL-2023]
MVELRKRREAPSDVIQPQLKKSTSSAGKTSVKANAVSDGPKPIASSSDGNAKSVKHTVGDTLDLDDFGGQVETHDGDKTTLKELLGASKTGVVLFTYPKASTPGCTTQACLFRDEYSSLTETGYSIFGLSNDSPKSNTTFRIKQSLPFTLLCDPNATLINAIGMKKAPKGTIRGVFVVSKAGIIEAAEPGGPAATVDVVRKLVQNAGALSGENVGNGTKSNAAHEDDEAKKILTADAPPPVPANTEGGPEIAAQVADTAKELDKDALV